MAKGIVHQIHRYVPGIEIKAICNRTAANARLVYNQTGITDIAKVETPEDLDRAIELGKYAITSDYSVICESDRIDLIVESTGHVDYGCQILLCAIKNRKPVVNMNAELDATVGSILQHEAKLTDTIVTGCDGDQPAAQMNLYRYVKSLGLTPLVCGNIKGLQDRYRTPATQASFAREWGQSATMVTSFADGTKISFEQALVANATGMRVATRGMLGIHHDGHIDDMTTMYDIDMLKELGGVVEYTVGPKPGPGVYVFGALDNDETLAHYLNYGKLGKGPLYSFYTPYHLTAMEVQHSIARVAMFQDHVITSAGRPVVDVVTAAKRDLESGQPLDGLGGFDTYGLCENYDISTRENLLPIGIAEAGVLRRPIKKDALITYNDIDLPDEKVSVKTRIRQNSMFKD